MENREAKYQLHTIWNGEFKQTTDFIIYDSQIRVNGFFPVKAGAIDVKIYSTELACFLCSTSFPATDQRTTEQKHINGHDYLKLFIDGFTEGIKYFQSEFKLSTDVLYNHSANYIETLKANYRRTGHKGKEGWNHVIGRCPLVITNSEIHNFGYYSGIVSKVHELAEQQPSLFKDFFQTKAPETTTSTEESKPLQLIDLFEEPSLFPKIIEILANAGLCDRHTKVWKDGSKGNRGTFAALMKDLHHKGYLERDFKNSEELSKIMENTFKAKISPRTIRSVSSDSLDKKLKELIPSASTLPKLPVAE